METETKEETKDEKANWVINLFVKRKWAEQLPAVKPIPGFCEYIQYFSKWYESWSQEKLL